MSLYRDRYDAQNALTQSWEQHLVEENQRLRKQVVRLQWRMNNQRRTIAIWKLRALTEAKRAGRKRK